MELPGGKGWAAPVGARHVLRVSAAALVAAARCAILRGGRVTCWGDNSHGELGDGTMSGPKSCAGDPCSPTPVAVAGISTATQITARNFQSCALLCGGGVGCWGDNADGQLGDGTTITRSTPVAVQGISSATQIAAGGLHPCAVLAGGGVDCRGNNADGQLGNGTISARLPGRSSSSRPRASGARRRAARSEVACSALARRRAGPRRDSPP